MKQLIVLISTVVLGIAIAGLVLGFREPAENLKESVTSQLGIITQECSNAAIDL